MTTKYVLYSTDGCHLCDLAYELLHQQGIDTDTQVVDIKISTQLNERFRQSIPVLGKSVDNSLLYWPFSATDLEEFIL